MNNLYLSRDLWYLALCCFGFSIACIITIFVSRSTLKQRNRNITGAILWVSTMLIFLTSAIIFSQGEVFFHRGFYLAGSIIFVLALCSWLFPRYVGFPLVIIAGFIVVAFAFLFLRFPSIDEKGPLVFRTNEANQAAVRILRSLNDDPADSSGEKFSPEFAFFQLMNTEDALTINLYEFHIDEALPFAGGQVRSSAVRIVQNGAIIFSNPMIARIPFQYLLKDETQKPFVFIKEYQQELLIEEL